MTKNRGAIIERVIDGIPVMIRSHDVFKQGTVTIRVQKKAITFQKLKPEQKKALQILIERGDFSNKAKMDAAELAGFTRENGVRTMDRLLHRKPIVKNIEDECQAKHKKGADEKVAEVLVDQLEAIHPLAKGEKKDNLAIINAAKEINKINDNYPPKRIQSEERRFNINAELSKDDLIALQEYKRMRGEL